MWRLPETIYRSLHADEKSGRPLIDCLRQRRPRRRPRRQHCPTRPFIPNRIGIEARPLEVDNPQRHADWEGDPVIGCEQQGAIVALVERNSMLLQAVRLLSCHAARVARAITFDNESEFAHHETITRTLDVDLYFAHPYAVYERARNENTNGRLRQYLPKGTRFTDISQHQLEQYVHELNNRP
jgi:IS30 family transposase